MEPHYFWLILFSFVAYLIVTDESVAKFFLLILSLARVNYEKTKWWLMHNPKNPIVKYLMWKNSMKLAKELMKELEEKNK